jgi:hypothetical protein
VLGRFARNGPRHKLSSIDRFGEQGVIIDLLGVIGSWNFLAVVMNAARTALLAGVADPLERYPE